MIVWLTLPRNIAQTCAMDRNPINIAFGKAVALRRDELGLTQSDLAKRVDLSRASIANIEKGRQNVLLHHVYDLAAALKMHNVGDILPARPQVSKPQQIDLKMSDPGVSARDAAQLNDMVATVLATRDGGRSGA